MNSRAHHDEEVQRLEQAGDWLLRLQDEALSEDELTQWMEWCEADPANLAAFESVQTLWREIPPGPLPASMAGLEPNAGKPLRAKHARVGRILITAGLGACAAAALLLALPQHREGQELVTQITTPARVNQNSLLPDGTHVDLSAGARLDLDFSARRRQVGLQEGMAYFRVKPDKERPFVVQAGPVNVTAVGTAFNVRRNGGRVVVTVQEGIVRVEKQHRTGEAGTASGANEDWTEFQARAGYQLIYDARSRETRLQPVDPSLELAWREGRLEYVGEPLDAVIANVNPYAAKRIRLGDPSLANLRYTGTVFVGAIDGWLAALPYAFPVAVRSDGAQALLLMRRDEEPGKRER